MSCPACRIWLMFPLRATGSRQLLPHVNGSPVLGVLRTDPTPQGSSVSLAFSVQVAYLSSLVAPRLGARRSLWIRVSPSVPRRPRALRVGLESAGIYGISQVLRRSSPCMPCPDDPGRPPESHPSDSFAWASRKRTRSPPASYLPFGAVPDLREVRSPLRPTWFPVYASDLSFGSSHDSPPTGLQHSVRVVG